MNNNPEWITAFQVTEWETVPHPDEKLILFRFRLGGAKDNSGNLIPEHYYLLQPGMVKMLVDSLQDALVKVNTTTSPGSDGSPLH